MIKGGSIYEEAALNLEMLWTKHFRLRSFFHSFVCPDKTQQSVLAKILQRNRDTTFGKKHNFALIRSEKEFRNQVSIHSYEELRPYIEKQLEKGTYELNSEKPVMYLQTSGTTGKPKYIPLGRDTLKSYQHAQQISSYIQYKTAQGIFSGKLLAIVSPPIEGHLDNGVSFGSMSGVVSQSLPKTILSRSLLPQEVLEISDYGERHRLIAAIAVCTPNITCLASANPSTFLKLSEVINEHIGVLLQFAETGDTDVLRMKLGQRLKELLKYQCKCDQSRAAELRRILNGQNNLMFCDLWPHLRAVVTWKSGNCGLLIPKLMKQLAPGVQVIDMGYLASEFWATITIDAERNFGLPTIQSNFYEFIEPEDWEAGNRDTTLLSELEIGKRYYIIVTTPDGLYRYFINDIIEVTGRHLNTPTIVFVQKGKGVTSLTGEKLYEGQVIQAVQEVSSLHRIEIDSFIMLADRQTFSYTLYVECKDKFDLNQFSGALNESLCELNIEYFTKLKSGRIKAAEIRQVKPGTFDEYKNAAIKSGQREGQFKTINLQYLDDVSFPFQEYECA